MRQRDVEGERRRTGVSLRDRLVVDAHVGDRVIVRDGAQAGVVEDVRVRRVRQIEREGLVRFMGVVAVHRDVHRLRRLARVECQRPRRGDVVAVGGRGRPVGRRVIDRDRLIARVGERDVEGHRRGVRTVALGNDLIVDADVGHLIVVRDRADPLAVRACGVDGAAQVHREGLIGLVFRVAVHRHVDGLGGVTRKEAERSGS